MSWQEEFEAAMKSFGVREPEPIEYRLHYDEFGRITLCSMQNHPTDTEYLIVTKEQYENYAKYAVDIQTKKLKIVVASNPGVSIQLKRSTKGWCTIKHHAGIILENDETHNEIEYYEANH